VSVATGIGPTELLALDAPMFEALVDEVDERWSTELELAATTLEVAHAHFLAYVRTHSKSSARIPDPLRVERPKRDEHSKPAPAKPVSAGELAALVGKSITPAPPAAEAARAE
jgi:hypothetical protein